MSPIGARTRTHEADAMKLNTVAFLERPWSAQFREVVGRAAPDKRTAAPVTESSVRMRMQNWSSSRRQPA